MKRHASLRPLSDDHHRALVLARRLRTELHDDDPSERAKLAVGVRHEFDADLEAHFRVEETWLLPALEARGENALVAETREDHARLRELVRGPWSRGTAAQIGALLEKHVRFEERVLFPKAETVLSSAELGAVHSAAERQEARNRECR